MLSQFSSEETVEDRKKVIQDSYISAGISTWHSPDVSKSYRCSTYVTLDSVYQNEFRIFSTASESKDNY